MNYFNDKIATFSVIIPAYQRPEQLHSCLSAFAKLSYPKENYEVIVVDGSPEPLDEPF